MNALCSRTSPCPSAEHSRLLKELRAVPVLQSLGDVYSHSKQTSRVLHTGLALLESSCSTALGVLSNNSMAEKLDSKASECVASLKQKYPGISKTTEEIKEIGEVKFRAGMDTVMRTKPAQLMLDGLDWSIEKAEQVLLRVKPRDSSPRKKPSRRTARESKGDHSYASEDSGACDAISDIKQDKHQQTKLTSAKKVRKHAGLPARIYNLGIVLPLELTIIGLKGLRWFLYPYSRRRRRRTTPEKQAQISARRKVSPRKKTKTTAMGSLRNATLRLLGLRSPSRKINLEDVPRDGHEVVSPLPDSPDADRKRKHDEVVTDPGSDESDEDLQDFDFENYKSDEDPDYKPDDGDSDIVSDDISDDEDYTESDLEIEVETLGAKAVQLTDKLRKPAVKNEHVKKTEPEKKIDEKSQAKSEYLVPKLPQTINDHTNVKPVNDHTNVKPVNNDHTNLKPVNNDHTNVKPVNNDHTSVKPVNKDHPNVKPVNKDDPNVKPVNKDHPNVKPVNKDHPNVKTVNNSDAHPAEAEKISLKPAWQKKD